MSNHIPWDQYFIRLAIDIATRSSCARRQVGSVIVSSSHHILSSGYNGTPSGMRNCNEGGCPRCNSTHITAGQGLQECLCVHAEENAICHAARYGIRLVGSTMYCTFFPCLPCAKALVSAGIVKLCIPVTNEEYPGAKASREFLNSAGIVIVDVQS
jgi:dCMP deaminase